MLQLKEKKKIDNMANMWPELRFEFIKIMKIRNEIKKIIKLLIFRTLLKNNVDNF